MSSEDFEDSERMLNGGGEMDMDRAPSDGWHKAPGLRYFLVGVWMYDDALDDDDDMDGKW